MEVVRLGGGDFTMMEWKNKQGKTMQLAIHPLDASLSNMDFQWRLSVAFMQAKNLFSQLNGYSRTILQIHGFEYPMKLTHVNETPTRETTLQPLEPFYFDGSDVVECDVAGFVKDFNVMTKQGVWRSHVDTSSNYIITPTPKSEDQNTNTPTTPATTTMPATTKIFPMKGEKSFLFCVCGGAINVTVAATGGEQVGKVHELCENEMLKITHTQEFSADLCVDYSATTCNTSVVFVDLVYVGGK